MEKGQGKGTDTLQNDNVFTRKEYIEREALLADIEACVRITSRPDQPSVELRGANKVISRIKAIPPADVLPRDEGIKLGAELAAMHGATPEKQQLEEAYLKGVEYGMTRRDVRPVVRCGECKWSDNYGLDLVCQKHSGITKNKFGEDIHFVEWHSKDFFCSDGERREHDG